MKPSAINKKYLLFYAFAFGVVAAIAFFLTRDASQIKAYTAGFSAGNIISDAVMRDYNSMSETEIQNFLKSKNHCNDTNLSKTSNNVTYVSQSSPYSWHIRDGHYVCMADESFNGQSAASIIYQAAQTYHINPKVLIVLLQKEQGLITDTYPNSIQYRSATGYGCPDTAPCDAQYYGLKNQVFRAADLFDTVLNGGWSNYHVGWNYIQYNPDSSCGGSDVYIENRATSALYRYTPYQPNTGALVSGYGTSYCGAYGNRNFYSYFTDWFGSTQEASHWEDMLSPRVMTVKQATVKVFPDSSTLDDYWLEPGRNIIFTSKTQYYRDGELITCLRTQADTNNNVKRCVLMPRLDEYNPTYSDLNTTSYYASQYTCKVNIRYLNVDCSKEFQPYTIIKATKSVDINGTIYYITTDDYGKNYYGLLAKRLTPLSVISFTDITPTYLRVNSSNASKLLPNMTSKVQSLEKDSVISFSSTASYNGTLYYRTTVDTYYNYAKLIPASMLSDNLFVNFAFPRELIVNRNTNRIDPFTNKVCENITRNTKLFFNTKTYVGGKYYYRTKDTNNNCSILADATSEITH